MGNCHLLRWLRGGICLCYPDHRGENEVSAGNKMSISRETMVLRLWSLFSHFCSHIRRPRSCCLHRSPANNGEGTRTRPAALGATRGESRCTFRRSAVPPPAKIASQPL